ncbi:MAG TPA: diguanylate cyclase [Allosphingosinicella sp.]|nr:diguanylate cyclase [Allosphingosinicella sp.]
MLDRAVVLRKKAGRRRLISLCALIAIAALFTLIIVNAFRVTEQGREAERWQRHSRNVLLVTGRLETAVNEAMRGERGYLLTNDRDFLAPYFRGRTQSRLLLRRLQSLTADNAVQRANLARVETRLQSYVATIDRLVRLQAQGRGAEAVAAVRAREGRTHIEDFLTALRRVDLEERRLLGERARWSAIADARADRYNYLMAAAAFIVVCLMAYAGFGAALGHKRAIALTEELQRMASTDALTGLPNRRRLMEGMELEVTRAERNGRPLAFALLDIDRFKSINDTHGHPAGDAVLQAVADELGKVTRAGDLLGRFGGEEFAIVMPETNLEQARWACERLRKAVAGRTMHYPNGTVGRVTISSGVALLAGEEGCDHLISRADGALYKAKEDGRDLVRLAA